MNKFKIPIWIWGKTNINTSNGFIYHEYWDNYGLIMKRNKLGIIIANRCGDNSIDHLYYRKCRSINYRNFGIYLDIRNEEIYKRFKYNNK